MMERPRVLKTSTDAPAGPGRTVRGFLYATLALLAVFACLQIWWVTTAAYGVTKGPRIVEIPPHQGLLDIARRLDEAGVIRSPFGFALLALAQGSARSLKAGEY
ncbi:MAG: Endolytic murein transglycosylase, partial [Candidatus Rokubacteria bacterium]|nr:Endolytic murein transglycosylase [Candidatus Rokubacteria bacterium]